MKRYGNVNGFIYRARQHEAPRPEPPEPEPEPPKPKPKPERQEEAAGESEAEWQARLQANWGDSKRCRKCGEVLPLECFYRNKNGALGRSSYCKACECENTRYKRELLKRQKAKGAQHGR